MLAMDRTELLGAAADAEAMAEQASVTVKEPLPVDDGSVTTSPARPPAIQRCPAEGARAGGETDGPGG